MKTAVQQIMLGSVTGNPEQAEETLRTIRNAGYDGIELNSFMIHPMGFMVKAMTRAAGMPIGRGGKLDWHALIRKSGLSVISLHSDLGSIEKDPDGVTKEAQSFHTDTVVITGMYRFDYSSLSEVRKLARRLNQAGKELKERKIRLLYHNHNCELQHVSGDCRAYDVLMEETDPESVNFEFDSYWMCEGGADAKQYMKKLGSRMKLWHINDRGCRKNGPYMTPILKSDAVELGHGNMDLEGMFRIAEENGTEAVVLEQHKNFIHKDPLESIQISSEWFRKHAGGRKHV